jgi:hypothetical protein
MHSTVFMRSRRLPSPACCTSARLRCEHKPARCIPSVWHAVAVFEGVRLAAVTSQGSLPVAPLHMPFERIVAVRRRHVACLLSGRSELCSCSAYTNYLYVCTRSIVEYAHGRVSVDTCRIACAHHASTRNKHTYKPRILAWHWQPVYHVFLKIFCPVFLNIYGV